MMHSEELRSHIAEQLKAARIKAGITVTEAAEALGKNKNTIYGYELGRILPTADVFLQVMVLYGIKDFDIFMLNNQLSFDSMENEQTQRIDQEGQEMLYLMQNADEQGKAAAKAVLQTFQRKDTGNDAGNIIRFIK